ncbi:ABC transporter permease subunit [bacterium]|nr:ABC transporter permease subunit [bacterium]
MRKTPFWKYALLYLAAAVAFCLLLVGASWVMRPARDREIVSYPPEEINAAKAVRRMLIDRENPPVLYREVDYSQGESGAWWPKSESPILADLVEKGDLPPVAERVGSEPCVLEGVEGIGKHGGTWFRLASATSEISVMSHRMAYSALLRWSPEGYPIVPHVAKGYEVSPDNREFTFRLRKGMKWSDGYPFTADDILYWWEGEILNETVGGVVPSYMKVRGKPGRVEKIDEYTVRFSFPEPNGIFLYLMATVQGSQVCGSPKHYLEQYQPDRGDQERIEARMRARNFASKPAVYRDVKDFFNPEHPRLWPWIYRTYKSNPPQSFVRNPYYFVVDSVGNQLPYVDQVHMDVKSPEFLAISVAAGQVTMQARHIDYDSYTHLMSQREKYGYDIYHWYSGDRSYYVIHPNLNRRVDPDDPASKFKHNLLNDKRFRKALSVALNREEIIEAEYNGQAVPAQCAPGPASYFYEPELYNAFTQYDPDEANRLLDEIGLTRRDFEGYRTYPDGSRMTFYMNFSFTGLGPGQFVVDDWGKVGIRLVARERSRGLFSAELFARKADFNVWIGSGEYTPLLDPRAIVPVSGGAYYAVSYARWYERGGLYGLISPDKPEGIEPPVGHPVRRAMEVYDDACQYSDVEKQREVFREALLIAADNLWTLNICTPPPVLMAVQDGFRNVPDMSVYCWNFQSPGNAGIETFYFDDPVDLPGATEQMKHEIIHPTLPSDTVGLAQTGQPSGRWLGSLVRYGFLTLVVLLLLLVAVRHPYIGRRMLIMIPTLLVISVIAFTVIQLPPGDYVQTRIMQLQESGDEADVQQIEDLKKMFFLEEPLVFRYARWLGLGWFRTFDEKDAGLLQGNMGRSMESLRSVNSLVGDRVLLTFLISLGTILFTWSVAIPIGIYSAVKQYSIGDYVLTFIGFIGMCVPDFLLAILLIFFAEKYAGISVSGLFSPEYGAQPNWSWGKVFDLLQHIWMPIVVLGVVGTAAMIRVMRANLLDELCKPYVVTARAKGMRPLRLLFKYPVRMALNPFISGIGAIFPQLVSGGAIVAIVLSLPTVGPLMLSALFSEDMYLAGSMLMVLSMLSVVGTLVSDLLLLWLDPRIRFKGGIR